MLFPYSSACFILVSHTAITTLCYGKVILWKIGVLYICVLNHYIVSIMYDLVLRKRYVCIVRGTDLPYGAAQHCLKTLLHSHHIMVLITDWLIF